MTDTVAQQFIDWISTNLDKKAGKTQSGLAEALGVAHPQVTQLVKGKRDLKVREVPVVAKYLNVAPPAWPGEMQTGDRIVGDDAILATLRRIEGLTEYDIDVAFTVIKHAITSRNASREPSRPDDQSEQSSPRREPVPSDQR